MENIIINIDSEFRDSALYPNPGSFTFKPHESLKNITYVRLSSIELPVVFYTFTAKNNNISFTILFGNQSQDVVIQEGNFDSATIITEIQDKLNVINNNYGTTFRIDWNYINYKISIVNKTAFTLIFDNAPYHKSLGTFLGFIYDNDSYLASQQLTKFDIDTNMNLYFWTGDTILNVSKDDYLFLRVNDYGVVYNDVRSPGILAKVLIYDSQFVMDTGANFLSKSYTFKQPTTINKLDIELIDKRGNTIDMNSINFSFTLEFGQIYDKNQYTNFDFQVK